MVNYRRVVIALLALMLESSPIAAQTATSVQMLPEHFAEIKARASAGEADAQFQLGQLAEDSAGKLDAALVSRRGRSGSCAGSQ